MTACSKFIQVTLQPSGQVAVHPVFSSLLFVCAGKSELTLLTIRLCREIRDFKWCLVRKWGFSAESYGGKIIPNVNFSSSDGI
jgi:hypothetical protein